MQRHHNRHAAARSGLVFILATLIVSPASALSPTGPLTLATSPLLNSTTSTVQPNVMFTLDNSGSMSWDYLPDWVNDSGQASNASSDPSRYHNVRYNGVAYDPSVTYTPPNYFDSTGSPNSTTYPSMTGTSTTTGADSTGTSSNRNWNQVKNDAYGAQSSGTVSLIGTAISSTSSNKTVFANYVYQLPYSFTFTPGEYCKDQKQTTCRTQNAPDSGSSPVYIYPAYLRWCTSSALTTCQLLYSSTGTTYTYPRWPGMGTTTGKITINNGTTYQVVSSVIVNNQQILSASTAPSNSATTIANSVATAINACTTNLSGNCTTIGYTASSSNGVVTVTSPSTGVSWSITVNTSSTAAMTTPTVTLGSGSSTSPSISTSGITATITFKNTTSQTASNITIGSNTIMRASAASVSGCSGSGSSSCSSTLAANVAAAINNCAASSSGNCTVAGYSATSSGSTVTITGPSNSTTNLATTTNFSTSTASVNGANVQTPGQNLFLPIINNSANANYNYPGTSVKASTRTDCAGSSCTYAEEMTNYANWYTYYHTRMQAMKSAVSQAFATVGTNFRVGFNLISYSGITDTTQFLNPTTFNGTAKNVWYNTFFAVNPSNDTPLRGAISKIGRYYAAQITTTTTTTTGSGKTKQTTTTVNPQAFDPIQYSCQQNFSILSTDGYWNTGSETSTYGPYALDNKTQVLDQDANTLLPQYEGQTAANSKTDCCNSLADVAMYYYVTDLRNPKYNNCTGSLGLDVCQDNVFTSSSDSTQTQHVTQFTLGLGANGLLLYTPDYQTATSGDYYNLKNGLGSPVVTWGTPISNASEARIDDLWHAAVNGHGIYFSAKNPTDILYGFTTALNAIKAVTGAGSGAATSTLNPVPGNNFDYIPGYTTVQWTGNLTENTIDLSSGLPISTATWCAENVVANTNCPVPGAIQPSTISTSNGSTVVYNCVTANSTAANCTNGTLDSSNNCTVPLTASCTGQMAALVGPNSDTRTIYMSNGGASPSLVSFTYANMGSAQQAYFQTSYLSPRLNQWVNYSTTQQNDAVGTNLVNFLRGQNGYENRSANSEILYRFRAATLGDIVNAQPTYLGPPQFSYADTGYATFVTNNKAREGMVYVGANDGMLHAFDASTGVEKWAFVPTAVMPNLWKLADIQYTNSHAYYVDGGLSIGDVYDSSSATWHTILVGGLGAGGREYYALDITNPTAPKLLWEVAAQQPGQSLSYTYTESNLGYTYGAPVIVKNNSGQWVVVFASGYNNINPGDGGGRIFVRNALTGAPLSTNPQIATTVSGANVGTASVPSGLSKLASWADSVATDNTSGGIYGGDLLGNVWRFDINAGTSFLFAVLKDASNNTQPITAKPELGSINSHRVIYIGTGKLLETIDLADTQQQSIYAIEDYDFTAQTLSTTTLVSPRTSSLMVQDTAVQVSATQWTINSNGVDWSKQLGWYVDLPSTGERIYVDLLLVAGRIQIASFIPSTTVCSPNGNSHTYNLDYATGIGTIQTSSVPVVGITYVIINGQVYVLATNADGTVTLLNTNSTSSSTFGSTRVMWRELITQ